MHLGAKIDLQSWGAFQSTFNFAPVETYSISFCNWLSLLKIPIPSATFKPQISPNIQFPVAQDITSTMSPWLLHRLLGVDISYVLCLTVESRRSLGRIQWVHGTRSIKSMKSTKSMSFERFSKKQAVWSASVRPWSPRLFDAWTASWILTMASFCGEVWTWGMGLSRPRFGAVHSRCFSRVCEILRITW